MTREVNPDHIGRRVTLLTTGQGGTVVDVFHDEWEDGSEVFGYVVRLDTGDTVDVPDTDTHLEPL